MRNIRVQERRLVVQTCHGEKERKTKADVDGQCKCGLEDEGTVGLRCRNTGLCGGIWSDTSNPHRSGKRCGRRRNGGKTV